MKQVGLDYQRRGRCGNALGWALHYAPVSRKRAPGELMHSLGTGGSRGTANIQLFGKGRVSRIQRHYFVAQFRALLRVYETLDMNLLRLKSKDIDGYMA